MTVTHRWIANLSLLFTELPLTERPAAAARAGFDGVEFWWPFGTSGTPDTEEVDAFIDAVRAAGVELYAMNLFGGDMHAGERGVLSYPERVDEFRASVRIAARVAEELGTRFFNAPYGHRRDGLDPVEQDALADENLAYAAQVLAATDGTALLEPLGGMPRYPLKTAESAFDVIARLQERGIRNVGYLLDQYHAMIAGEDAVAIAREHARRIVHIQIADAPNRGEPGSGDSIEAIRSMIDELDTNGYSGVLSLEYIPTTAATPESLDRWRAEFPHETLGGASRPPHPGATGVTA